MVTNSMKVAAVIVTYNRKNLLIKNIEHLINQTRKDILNILIIDNNSTDGTFETIKQYIDKKEITYINTGENLGGAGGFNFGIRKAIESGFEYVWLMDDDTLPRPDALEKFMVADKKLNGQYGFLSSKVLWKDGSICKMNEQKISKWRRLKTFDTMCPIQYASFVSLFLKADIIKSEGLPYKEFFIWSDDWEYTRRISRKMTCYFVPESVVDHCCNSNAGADIVSTSEDRIDRFKYMFRNDVVLYRLDGFEGMAYLWIRTFYYSLKILLKSDYKIKKLRIMYISLKNGKKFHPTIEYIK